MFCATNHAQWSLAMCVALHHNTPSRSESRVRARLSFHLSEKDGQKGKKAMCSGCLLALLVAVGIVVGLAAGTVRVVVGKP
jgi:hypothetical protein